MVPDVNVAELTVIVVPTAEVLTNMTLSPPEEVMTEDERNVRDTPVTLTPPKAKFRPLDDDVAPETKDSAQVVTPPVAENPADVDAHDVVAPLTTKTSPVIVPLNSMLTWPVSVEPPIIDIVALVDACVCPMLVPDAATSAVPSIISVCPVTDMAWWRL